MVHASLVERETWAVLGGRPDPVAGAPLNVPPVQELAGATPGALESFLTIRGVRTLPLRLGRACASANDLARYLGAHPAVQVVRYPGLPSHPTHLTARRFMTDFGAVISFDVHGGAVRADAVCRALRIIRHATSLGGVESMIERRAAIPGQTHLPAGLLRLSVGCEHINDLLADLDHALHHTAELGQNG